MSGSQTEPRLPWLAGPIAIGDELLEQIEALAVEAYPSECCGLLAGPVEDAPRVDELMPEQNEADRYHALDPERFPRTSRTYFKINELRAARAFDSGATAGRPIKVIYHSHCDAGAYFSDEDAATFLHDDVLMWPAAFLVVSVVDGVATDRKLWVHRPGMNRFEVGDLVVVARPKATERGDGAAGADAGQREGDRS